MCKDKWNSLNSYYKKLADYHKGTRSYTYFSDLSFDENFFFHLTHQFNRKFYELIETFWWEKNFTTPLHIQDINVENDEICEPLFVVPETQDENEDF